MNKETIIRLNNSLGLKSKMIAIWKMAEGRQKEAKVAEMFVLCKGKDIKAVQLSV